MQKTKEINIGGKRYTIKELLVRDVWNLFSIVNWSAPVPKEADAIAGTINELKQQVTMVLERCVEIKFEDLLDLYPSEIEQLVDGIMEVNSSFFGLGERMGLQQLKEMMAPAILKEWNGRFALWLNEAIKKSGDMDGDSSCERLSQ